NIRETSLQLRRLTKHLRSVGTLKYNFAVQTNLQKGAIQTTMTFRSIAMRLDIFAWHVEAKVCAPVALKTTESPASVHLRGLDRTAGWIYFLTSRNVSYCPLRQHLERLLVKVSDAFSQLS